MCSMNKEGPTESWPLGFGLDAAGPEILLDFVSVLFFWIFQEAMLYPFVSHSVYSIGNRREEVKQNLEKM